MNEPDDASIIASFSKTQESFLEQILIRATTEMGQVHATALRQQQQEIHHLRQAMQTMQDKQDTLPTCQYCDRPIGTKKHKRLTLTCFECSESFRVENDRVTTHQAQLLQAAQARNVRDEIEPTETQEENQQSPTLTFLPVPPAPFDLHMIIPESVPNSPEEEAVDVAPVISPPNVHFRQLFTHIDYHESGGDREIYDSWKNDKDEGMRRCQY